LANALADSFDIYGLDIVGEQTERHYRVEISNFEALNHAFTTIGGIEYISKESAKALAKIRPIKPFDPVINILRFFIIILKWPGAVPRR